MAEEILFGKTFDEIKDIVVQLNMPVFTARQITEWLYHKDIEHIEQMTNISVKNRNILSKNYKLGVSLPVKFQESTDGTKKYLYRTSTGKYIETAYIPEEKRSTLCVSSQVGCKMGCLFCMTGKQGFQQHLNTGEIINQLRSLPEKHKVSNIVYMGMGEPFDNTNEVMKSLDILIADWGFGMSPRRITVSTIGIIPGMKNFLDNSQCHLAISLHSPFDEERQKLMPIQHIYDIKDIIQLIKTYNWHGQRRISFEYILFKGVNDSKSHINELSRLLNGLPCRINLIKFHTIPGTPLEGSDEKALFYFRDALTKKGLFTTIRQSRGEDIFAACGLLSTKAVNNSNN